MTVVTRTFGEFIKATSLVVVVELVIFFVSLAIYHFLVFRKKLAREIEIIRIQHRKLERITKGEPEPELHTPHLSSLEADKTQESEKSTKKNYYLTKKENFKKKNKKNKKNKEKTNKILKPLALEKTQVDDEDLPKINARTPQRVRTPARSPHSQQSFTDPGSDRERPENANAQIITDTTTLTRTPTLFEEIPPVFSPNRAPPIQAPAPLIWQNSPPPPLNQDPEGDVQTAREELDVLKKMNKF